MEGRGQGGRFGRATEVWLGCFLACTIAAGEVEAQATEAQAPSTQAAEATATPGYSEAIGEAIGHYSAGRWQQAQEAFARAHALQPSARTYRGLGLSAFYLDEFAAAREAFEQALADTRKPLPDEQRRELAELMQACARETGRVELRVAPPSARVELDGVGTERRVLFLDRGRHVLAVSAEGHVSERTTLTIAGGEERSLELALATLEHPAPVPAAIEPATPTEPVAESTGAYSSHTASADSSKAGGGLMFTWIAAAAVPVFAGVATAVWLTGKAEHKRIEDQCVLDGCNGPEATHRFNNSSLGAHETWTNVSLAASGVALVAASVLFVIESRVLSGSEVELSATGSGAALHARF